MTRMTLIKAQSLPTKTTATARQEDFQQVLSPNTQVPLEQQVVVIPLPHGNASSKVPSRPEDQQDKEVSIPIEFDRKKFLWYALALCFPLHVLFLVVLIVLLIMRPTDSHDTGAKEVDDMYDFFGLPSSNTSYQERYDMVLWVLLILWILAFSIFFLTSYLGLMGQKCTLKANSIEVNNTLWCWRQKREIPYQHLFQVQLIVQKRWKKYCDVQVIAIDTIGYSRGTDVYLVGVKDAILVQDAIMSRRLFSSSTTAAHPSNNNIAIATMA